MTINISAAAQLTGLAAKTIRYYEQIELIAPLKRNSNGYRYFEQADIQQLQFIKGTREAGFNLAQCKELNAIFLDQNRQSKQVKQITEKKISQIKQKISSLSEILQQLENLNEKCLGDHSSDCPILNGLLKK